MRTEFFDIYYYLAETLGSPVVSDIIVEEYLKSRTTKFIKRENERDIKIGIVKHNSPDNEIYVGWKKLTKIFKIDKKTQEILTRDILILPNKKVDYLYSSKDWEEII